MTTLKNKTAVVTGAGQGIGRGEALALAAEGAHVIVNDLGPGANNVVEEIRNSGGSAEVNNDDISDWEGGKRLVEQAIAHSGSLDILVCNAGIVRDRMVYNMTEAEWDAVIKVHLRGHFVPIRFAASHWREKAKSTGAPVYGRIITTTSEAGLFGHEGQANYSAAKAGILGLTMGVARELGRFGVTANSISPRGRTPMTDGAFGAISAMEGDFDAWDPENIGPWVAYLAGPDAAEINGQVFVVHGGTVSHMAGWSEAAQISQQQRWTMDQLRSQAAGQLIPGRSAQLDPFPDIIPAAARQGDR